LAVHSVHFVTTVYKKEGRERRSTYKGKPSTKLCPLGYRVMRWMKEAGLDRKDLATAAGMSDDSFDRFMRGKQAVTTDELGAIAHAVGAPADIMKNYTPQEAREQLGFHASRRRGGRGLENATRTGGRARVTSEPAQESFAERTARSYDPDEAAELLAKRFGDRVKRSKRAAR
jgi:transcriptional regulator with XRE-family HTH domain